jgi:hypothetical protein
VIGLAFRIEQLMIAGLVAGLLTAGCASTSVMDHRVARYRPHVDATVLAKPAAEVVAPVATEVAAVSVTEPVSPEAGDDAGEQTTETATRTNHGILRSLGAGDRLVIYLRGIPRPEEIKDVIDGFGTVTLPYLGEVKLAGKTTSQAERLIENSYVKGKIYQQINVIVVAEDEMYFVQGQVSRQGKFPLSGPVTLLQAISVAGGFTPFANRKKIKIIRGSEVLVYNAKDIAAGKQADPPIRADDIIEILQKVI